jgi:hypothetical protein
MYKMGATGSTKSIRADGATVYMTIGGELHRNFCDQPAVIKKTLLNNNENTYILEEEWWMNGIQFRFDEKPAYVKTKSIYGVKKVLEEGIFSGHNLHVVFCENGDRAYYNKNKQIVKILRKNGSVEFFYKNGNKIERYTEKQLRSMSPSLKYKMFNKRKGSSSPPSRKGRGSPPPSRKGRGSPIHLGRKTSPNKQNTPLPKLKPNKPEEKVLQLCDKPKDDGIRKMPENLSSLLPERDRDCTICLNTLNITDIYTSKDCFHIYCKDCLTNLGKCRVCNP